MCLLNAATNVIEVIRDGWCQPRELYGSQIEIGDLIIDIFSANCTINRDNGDKDDITFSYYASFSCSERIVK